MSSKIKNSITGLVLVFLSVFLAVFVVEVMLRFTMLKWLVPRRNDFQPVGYYAHDDSAGYDIAPRFATSTHKFADGSFNIWSNSIGCYDTEYAGGPYIYLAGDSFTWGFSAFEDKWGKIIEDATGLRTLKCGVNGYGTKQSFLKAKKIINLLREKPSLIILGYYENDALDDSVFPGRVVYDGYLTDVSGGEERSIAELVKDVPMVANLSRKYCMPGKPVHPSIQRVKCFMFRNSIVYHLVKNTIKNLVPQSFLSSTGVVNVSDSYDMGEEKIDLSFAEHLGHILELKLYADSIGSSLFVVIIPTRAEVYDDKNNARNEKVARYLFSHGIEYLDLTDKFRHARAFSDESLYWKQDGHWNARGNHLAGYLIARHIIYQNLTEVENTDIKITEINSNLSTEFGLFAEDKI